jgi:hypothetical protein
MCSIDQGDGKRRLALMLTAGAAIHTRHQRRL